MHNAFLFTVGFEFPFNLLQLLWLYEGFQSQLNYRYLFISDMLKYHLIVNWYTHASSEMHASYFPLENSLLHSEAWTIKIRCFDPLAYITTQGSNKTTYEGQI